jgi:hypothetical protein
MQALPISDAQPASGPRNARLGLGGSTHTVWEPFNDLLVLQDSRPRSGWQYYSASRVVAHALLVDWVDLEHLCFMPPCLRAPAFSTGLCHIGMPEKAQLFPTMRNFGQNVSLRPPN